ncbi:MAG: hypothetical protein CMH57_09750 [Myxococcales bacterium]|nr:hypothetical protein [Myxococcales bacterium]
MGDDHNKRRNSARPRNPQSARESSATLPLHRVPGSVVRSTSSARVMQRPSSPQLPAIPDPDSGPTTEFEDDDAVSAANTLRIRAGSFSVELEGDSDFVQASYELMRQQILQRLRDILRKNTARGDRGKAIAQRASHNGGFIWVYVCHPLYNKIHIVSRDTLSTSALGSVIHANALNKIYVDRRGLAELETLIGSSKTLWSELTTEGRERLKRAGS